MRIKSRKMKDRRGTEKLRVNSASPFEPDDDLNPSAPISPNDPAQYYDQTQFETDKRAVYKHPLFPLLALLFEKCEMATNTTSESPISDTFHNDLEAFVQHQERDRKAFLANDPEVDSLMIKAIQVLRIHLLEMDKVQELCKDFCTRYITCLKSKMQSENLLRSDYYDTANGGGGGCPLGGFSSHSQSNSPHHSFSSSGNGDSEITNNHGLFPQGLDVGTIPAGYLMNNNNTPGGSCSGPPHPMPQSPEESSSNQSSSIHGGTPLSAIGSNNLPNPLSDNFVQNLSTSPATPGSSVEDEDDFLGRRKPKRGVLPKQATSVMRSWLFQHIVHPYPTEDEKRTIASQTNLTLLQVNNWFINARRRILQPMLDASNPDPSCIPKVKKLKTQNSKPALKYWSDNIGSEPSNGLDQNESSEESEDENNALVMRSSEDEEEVESQKDDKMPLKFDV